MYKYRSRAVVDITEQRISVRVIYVVGDSDRMQHNIKPCSDKWRK
jgi:hypothetical protein